MMPCIGNIVNTVAVIVAGAIGLLLKKGISSRLQNILMQALGMCTIFIGISGALQNMFTLDGGKLAVNNTITIIISMVIGSFVGELIDIETLLDKLGEKLKKLARAGNNSSFTEGFVTVSLIICVGAMAVVGGIADGLGDPSVLFAKTVLDSVIALIFSSTLGVGVMFSALPMFLYQGIFNVIGIVFGNIMSDALLVSLSAVGNVLIFGVGVNLAFGKRLKVGNMLPALLVPVVWEIVSNIIA